MILGTLVLSFLREFKEPSHLTTLVSLVVHLEPPPSPPRLDMRHSGKAMRRALAAEVVDVARTSPQRIQIKKTSLGLYNAGCGAAARARVLLLALPNRTPELDQASVNTPDDGGSFAAPLCPRTSAPVPTMSATHRPPSGATGSPGSQCLILVYLASSSRMASATSETISLIKSISLSFQWYKIVFSLVCHCCAAMASSGSDARSAPCHC